MTVYLFKPMPGGPGRGTVQLLARMEFDATDPDRRITAHYAQVIGPGWKVFGRTYEEWAALPAGPHEIPEDADFSDDHPGPDVALAN